MIIGIGGVSNSGKSALVIQFSRLLKGKSFIHLCQDDFVLPKDDIPKIKNHINWESPASINFDNFRKEVILASTTYDVVVAEGLMIFHDPLLIPHINHLIFLEISKAEFLKRKENDLRWGKEPGWYMLHIWESYLQHGLPPENIDVLRISVDKGLPPDDTLLQQIIVL